MNGFEMSWTVPEYSGRDRLTCRLGLHLLSRRRMVTGRTSNYVNVEHHYCACGRHLWMTYDGSWVSHEAGATDQRADWIASQDRTRMAATEMRELVARFRARSAEIGRIG